MRNSLELILERYANDLQLKHTPPRQDIAAPTTETDDKTVIAE